MCRIILTPSHRLILHIICWLEMGNRDYQYGLHLSCFIICCGFKGNFTSFTLILVFIFPALLQFWVTSVIVPNKEKIFRATIQKKGWHSQLYFYTLYFIILIWGLFSELRCSSNFIFILNLKCSVFKLLRLEFRCRQLECRTKMTKKENS